MGDNDKAKWYYGQALDELTNTDNLVYRDIISSKALCDYQTGYEVDSSLFALKTALSGASDEEERLTRFLTIGVIFAEECLYDTALLYLEPVFNNEKDVGSQIQAAECLRVIYDSLGNNEKSDVCVRFLANQKKSEGENKALTSKLEELFKTYIGQKQEKQAKAEREEAVRRAKGIIIPIAVAVVLTVVCVLIIRSRKLLEKKQEEADKALGKAEQEHEKELRLRQAVADKTLEKTRKKYEEELRQLKAETEQQLEDVERKHQQWMATTKERHEEELRVQKDLSGKEIEETQKRHEEELEAERQTHRMEQAAISGRLKRSNQEVRELKDQIKQMDDLAAKTETAASFDEEPICRLIMERVNEGQFKSKIDYINYKDSALDKQQLLDLRLAVDRHFRQFTVRLKKTYPELTNSDLDYCCLYLLGLNDADIAALMQRAYNTVVERDGKLKKIFGNNEPLPLTLASIANEELFI